VVTAVIAVFVESRDFFASCDSILAFFKTALASSKTF
jgi:hypothetical protein